MSTDFEPVAEAAAHSPNGVPFSLSGESSRSASCRVGVAPSLATGRPEGKTSTFEHGKKVLDGRLSRPFAASTSHDEGSVEVIAPNELQPSQHDEIVWLLSKLEHVD